MDQKDEAPLHPSVARKVDAVFGAIEAGHSAIAAIAGATHLSETTVIRVAALLRDRGRIGVDGAGELAAMPAAPR